MKKLILLLLCGVFMSLLGACEKGASTESSSSIENNSSVEQSESIESGDEFESSSMVESSSIVESSSKSEYEEGGEGALVNGYYEFSTYQEYTQFYDEFVKVNEERYYAPIVSINEKFDTTNYIFKVAPIPFEVADNDLYVGVEFPPSQTMEFYFFKQDNSVVGVHKSVTIRGEIFDVSEETLVGNKVILVQTDDEGREYNVCLGETILCSFEIGMTGYDNKAEYLQLIESGFNFN